MTAKTIDAYRDSFRSDPDAFLEGVASFCKQAEYDDERTLWQKLKPWLFALGGGYLALKLGERWGRYAEKNDNPAGPIKGPIGEALEWMLPGRKVVWPGSKEYDRVKAVRTAQDDATWNRMFGNSVANGKAMSLTMR